MKEYFFAVLVALSSLFYSPGVAVEQVVYVIDEEVVNEKQAPIASRIDIDDEQYQCLALAVYFEARNQPIHGQAAVAMVVLNRAEDRFWPKNICDVVKQGSYITGKVERDRCQFSWYCDGRPNYPSEYATWNEIQSFARQAFYAWNIGYDITYGATNFHTTGVRPRWRHDPGMEYIATIGDHIFYYWNRPNNVAFD